MSKIYLHASLQRFAEGYETVEIPGNCDLEELLKRLISEFSRLKTIIFSKNANISPYIVIYVNGQDARNRDAKELIPANGIVEIITSLVGG